MKKNCPSVINCSVEVGVMQGRCLPVSLVWRTEGWLGGWAPYKPMAVWECVVLKQSVHSLWCSPSSCSPLFHGHTDPTSNGLQLGVHGKLSRCSTGLCFNMEQKLWALALILVLLETGLDLFHGGMKGDETLRGTPLTLDDQ